MDTTNKKSAMRRLTGAIAVAALLWGIMFSPLTAPKVDFWAMMTVSALVLIAIACLMGKGVRQFSPKLTDVLLGIASAAVLWGVFWVCNWLSRLVFSFAGTQVGAIYSLRTGHNPWVVGALLMCIIGPAEELFWRGTVQRMLSAKWGPVAGFFAASAVYALVHVWSLNLMLIGAAAVCGGFWALIYAWRRNLTAVMISHCLWDVAVFLVFPIS
mgnify:FL=1